MNQSIKSRIAPTPSGFLHLGNAYNFLVIYRETVIKREGKLHLRIDDSDSGRVRDEYISDVFDTLKWLEIPIESGPKNLEDFKTNYSQYLKKDYYKSFLKKLPDCYVCECSRSFLKENNCPCFKKDYSYEPGKNAIRHKVKNEEVFKKMGDFIIWRKDDLPSYQLASLIDDIDEKINLIIRGEDLIDSTKAQFYLAELLNDKIYTSCSFLHHPLIKTENGEKISKSQNSENETSLILKNLRANGTDRDGVLKKLGFSSWEHFLNS
ncbi:MAG: tRNA glutamyl-Q synthetase [Halobacteriovorax sp.]|nr:tRNA glutamyl-Q synthetase [Halobacteriovorax sp.]|tara:strand:- start:63829 stop:64623 length:795 start_codon:yes stop_codon:yes gene_type:complete